MLEQLKENLFISVAGSNPPPLSSYLNYDQVEQTWGHSCSRYDRRLGRLLHSSTIMAVLGTDCDRSGRLLLSLEQTLTV